MPDPPTPLRPGSKPGASIVTAATVIRILLELDQQCLTARPSGWGKAALLVRELCAHAKGGMSDDELGRLGRDRPFAGLSPSPERTSSADS